MKNQKITNIRAFAVIIVIFGHSIILYSNSWNLYQTQYNVPFLSILKDIIDIVQMPLFFSVSGFLFYYSSHKNISIVKFIKNKFMRLIVPYLFVAFFYMVPIRLALKYETYKSLGVVEIAKQILLGINSGHLWFLYALFIIFLVMWVIDKLLKKFGNNVVYIVVFFIFALLSIVSYDFKFICINDACRYLIWFYAGYLINKWKFVEKNINIKSKVLGSVLTITLLVICLVTNNKIVQVIFTLDFIIMIYVLIPSIQNKYVDKFSENSFGIYLFHSPLIYITFSFWADVNPLVVVLTNLIVWGMVAYVLGMILRNTKLKFIVGE